MKLGIILTTKEPEKAWNAMRLANFALKAGDEVKVFLTGEGVEASEVADDKFNIKQEMNKFLEGGGQILACGTCLKLRHKEASEICPLSTLEDLYRLILLSEKVLTF
ncbi:DsrE family protein [Thermosulfurimonas dismutans]|uniref:Uncharacterized protein n=1 Tax=Thermosulfurimonas dismutans TaxID=999894 RepID=A0A179D888_9BACT|nr:DsrE family protein [Thermosulfurimonas dismutans]OAQ21652.1 hypothetical protein TDIS_0170 [Thermosulfurimonas dismutans]